jgi:serine/threonine protein kinase
MPNELHFYTKYSKEKIKISDKPFASGGEGAVYAIASPRNYSHLVAKIYYPEKRTEEREAKMHYLMQHPPILFQKGQPPSIGWVQDVIYKDNRFLGILLIKIEGKKLTKLTLAKLSRRADKAWQRFAFQDPDSIKLRLRTCFNLAVVIYQIHEYGQYVLVDLKPDNVLMQPNGLLAIVDMDSVEVVKDGKAIFAAPVATPEYTPPEHYTGPRGVIDETWDRFSLGIIFYQLLLGLHPFAASSHPPYDNLVSIHDKIQHHLYVHNEDKKEFLKVIPPPHNRHDQLPIEVQKLFQDCFVLGAEKPFSRPSALDWCSTLAKLLNLPFKGVPDYKLPFNQLPKIDFQPSSFYFEPSSLILNLDIDPLYEPSTIEVIDLGQIAISSIVSIKKTSPSIVPETEQKKLWDAMEVTYKEYIRTHRNSIFTAIAILIPIIAFSVLLFPLSLIFGAILLFSTFPKLIFRKSRDIIHNIGEIILPTSIKDISFKHETLLASNKRRQSTIEVLKTKKEALELKLMSLRLEVKKNAKQHLEKVNLNKTHLSDIKQNRNLQQALIDSISEFDPWVEQEIKSPLTEIRVKKIEAYTDIYDVFAKEFTLQLQDKKVIIKDTFRDFNNDIFKREKTIALQQGKLPKIKDEKVKQQMLINCRNDLEASNFNYALELESYEIENKKLLPIEIRLLEPQKALKEKLRIQLKYNKRRQQSALKKARKKLGKNFQVNLKRYLELLYESEISTELHFAHNKVREQFELFQEEIPKLKLDAKLQHKLSNLFTPEEDTKWTIIPLLNSFNLPVLEAQQVGMLDEWTLIEEELQKLQKKIAQLKLVSEYIDDTKLKNQWLEGIKTSIINIKASQDAYHQYQETFYNDSQIALIYKELKQYHEIVQRKQDLEDDFATENALLDKDIFVPEERIQLNQDLVEYKQKSILEKEKKAQEITLAYEKEFAKIEEQWDLEIQQTEENIKRESDVLAELKIDFQSFKDDIETTVLDAELAYSIDLEKTRSKFDTIYKDYQTTYDEKLAATTEEHRNLAKRRLAFASQVETHRVQHLTNANYDFTYNMGLATLRNIEQEINAISREIVDIEQTIENTTEEKIKIETLIKWQENYDSKIYIKDLLLNKVELFKEEEKEKKS